MTKVVKNAEYEKLSQREFDPAETLKVLKHPVNIYWSWGVEKVVNYYDKGLILLVDAHHHKGVVFIRLSWDDTYSYFLLNPNLTVKKQAEGIYFDELQERLDRDIEYIDAYNN